MLNNCKVFIGDISVFKVTNVKILDFGKYSLCQFARYGYCLLKDFEGRAKGKLFA